MSFGKATLTADVAVGKSVICTLERNVTEADVESTDRHLTGFSVNVTWISHAWPTPAVRIFSSVPFDAMPLNYPTGKDTSVTPTVDTTRSPTGTWTNITGELSMTCIAVRV